MLTLTALIVLVTLALTAAQARPTAGGWAEFRAFADERTYLIQKTVRVRDRRCLPPRRVYHRNTWFRGHPGLYANAVGSWRGKVRADRQRDSRCIPYPWNAIADCETGDSDGQPPYRADWDYNGPSGFDGGVQFHPDTWNRAKRLVRGAGRYAFAYQAPARVQVRVAAAWLRETSWLQWPACSARIGAR